MAVDKEVIEMSDAVSTVNGADAGAIEQALAAAYHEMEAARARLRDLRKQMPVEDVQDYALARADGSIVMLSELFGEHDDLLVVHNMGRGCAYCTLWADGFVGLLPHLERRAAFAVSTPDAPEVQREFAASRGWPFAMVSTRGSTFTQDMGYWKEGEGYWPGVSAFRRLADGRIQRVGRDFFGPGDQYCGAWHLFDLLADGANGWQPVI